MSGLLWSVLHPIQTLDAQRFRRTYGHKSYTRQDVERALAATKGQEPRRIGVMIRGQAACPDCLVLPGADHEPCCDTAGTWGTA